MLPNVHSLESRCSLTLGSTDTLLLSVVQVMLHNDSVNRREYVVRVLLKVIKSLSVDDAVNAMQQAHLHGLACVIACAQDEAEQYCEGLRSNGLIASIEPAGTGSGGDEPSV